MDAVEKLYPCIKRESFHVNERQLVRNRPLSPLNLSHIPCGLNPHSPIFSPLALPFLSSPSPAFPNPCLLLAGQAHPSNFSPHGYFRTHLLSTIQTLLSYWKCCCCSTPWPGSWSAGPRTPNNPKANEPSHLDMTLHLGHNLRQTARFRPGRAPISLPRSVPLCLHFLAPWLDLQSPPAPHTFLAHLWELPLETKNLHTLSRTVFTPWLHWHPSSTEVKLSFAVVQSLSHVQLWPCGLQHTRLPCSSPSPSICSGWYPLSCWCHPTISSSVVPFSSCLQSFPASGSFPMSWPFTSGPKVLEFQLQHQSFQWTLRVDFL